ncbi:hypothetical protein CYR55_09925 [Chimaeribacter californicus]|uniref:Inner membrane protein n=1 Tax=Chimaeribacter californicus TaxID=2060067 RepID=A0A2N5E6Z5_9GAMM|nr:inner membrane protein YbjM [Chimaeribacter californicus]PLR37251.1 hypothetical protein CYR55_09925 [Chimaeribacter californicus]
MTHVQGKYGTALCCLLFLTIFIMLKTELIVVRNFAPGPEYGLLLFMLPGMVTTSLVKQSGLFAAFFGAVLAIPLCYLIRVLYFVRVRPLWQEMAYAASAIFWCVLGALIFMLIQGLWQHWHRRRAR